jgi:hypothetical protein
MSYISNVGSASGKHKIFFLCWAFSQLHVTVAGLEKTYKSVLMLTALTTAAKQAAEAIGEHL